MSTTIIIGIEMDWRSGKFASRDELEEAVKNLLEGQTVETNDWSEYEIGNTWEYDSERVHLGLKLVDDRAKPGGMRRS